MRHGISGTPVRSSTPSKPSKPGRGAGSLLAATVTATATAALALGTLATAPAAAAVPRTAAVKPRTATVSFDCGSYGSGTATLTAAQDGTAATIEVSTSAISAPIDLGAGSVSSTLTLTKNGTGTTEFTGNSNPAIPAGGVVSTGPLTGTVTAGDSLEGKSLRIVVLGITVTCAATSAQSPGPFVF